MPDRAESHDYLTLRRRGTTGQERSRPGSGLAHRLYDDHDQANPAVIRGWPRTFPNLEPAGARPDAPAVGTSDDITGFRAETPGPDGGIRHLCARGIRGLVPRRTRSLRAERSKAP